ncbi:MAG: DevR family CRISPR-associated autoregulator [Candidatus Binatia bacterium]|nr:DevR family CRISPR-associated autoregulator [Candidatus Binatia bacterium]
MCVVHSLSLCTRITLDLHSLNNEGTEGNQQQTRMVHIIDQHGQRAVVNAISGDMFKHILVEHLVPLLQNAGQPLSPGAAVYDADRINTHQAFVDFCEREVDYGQEQYAAIVLGKREQRKALESEIMSKMLTDCSLTDIAGTLVTRGRAVGRKSVVEFGWVVGIPQDGAGQPVTVTEQYFHVKYAAEGRGAAAGGETVAGKQAIFHRPASSGVYALICNLDVYRIGLNDITRQYVVDRANRQARAKALVHALASTLLKPTGAQRNTQNPHIVACEGVVAVSSTSLPAPTVSPLHDNYRAQVARAAAVLNEIRADGVMVRPFETLADGVEVLAEIARDLAVPEGTTHGT